MRLEIDFATGLAFDPPVRYVAQYLRLTPRDTARQRVVAWRLEAPSPTQRIDDRYGNVLEVLTLDQPMKPFGEVRLRATGIVETQRSTDEPSDFAGAAVSPLVFLRETPLTQPDAELRALAEAHRRAAGSASGLRELAGAARAQRQIDGLDGIVHAFVAACRLLGVPARYVSGMIHSGEARRASLHAWAEAWVFDRWRSFDVAKDSVVNERHVKLAFGADALEARPIRSWPQGGFLDPAGPAPGAHAGEGGAAAPSQAQS